ncbi:MAG: sigma-70 family RNA polymerase sigma factor [Bryobacteraceae bacterium]|nr:sigma-70 family RNA polymerase sigma factor [Bryobacteraceae bacterium]MDW8377452.1 sigma-70 family RNA polymerase sigma factor [Bryobacterales bacterium]
MFAESEEVALARRLLSGDRTAFDRFVELFQRKLFHYVYMMCGHREDAEEVAQETLLKMFEHFDQLREPERVKPWAFTIARNVCHMKRRKSIFAPEEEISLDDLMPQFRESGDRRKLEIADWSRLPDDEAIRREVRVTLEQVIRELPDIYKSVLLLRDVEELTTEETAEVLGVSADVVKTRLHRARLLVRNKIDKHLLHSVGAR